MHRSSGGSFAPPSAFVNLLCIKYDRFHLIFKVKKHWRAVNGPSHKMLKNIQVHSSHLEAAIFFNLRYKINDVCMYVCISSI